jgi:hypothetical protein
MRGNYSTESILFNTMRTAVLCTLSTPENFPLRSKQNKASHKYGINNQWPAAHTT